MHVTVFKYHHGPTYVLFSFKDWTLELRPSPEFFRISPLHQRVRTVYDMALLSTEWWHMERPASVAPQFCELMKHRVFFFWQQWSLFSRSFFLLSFVGDVNKYSQLIAAVYHRINSRDFRIQVFQDYWTKNQPTPIENMKHIYWYFDFYLHSLKLT